MTPKLEKTPAMTNAIEPDLVFIPGGSFRLGEPAPEGDLGALHPWDVHDTEVPGFFIARKAVGVGEFKRFVESTGYPVDPRLASDSRFSNPEVPVAYTSWLDALHYVLWLARTTGKPYRLVRDAEYEKAARGGLSGRLYPWGDESPEGRADFSRGDAGPLPRASFAPNGLGLHDMAGSMWCWCEERYDEVSREDKARLVYEDTIFRDTRLNAVCRGGSFRSPPSVLRCAYRHEDPIDLRLDCMGFRVAMDAPAAH
jgi:formylglycine-generating enzyme required for sulfatase activity